MTHQPQWYDDEAGPIVRPYTITRGRVPSEKTRFDVSTQVKTVPSTRDPVGLTPEHKHILERCHVPLSIAELGASLAVPLAVVQVLCSDLITRGDVIVRTPAPATQPPDRELLELVLNGLKQL